MVFEFLSSEEEEQEEEPLSKDILPPESKDQYESRFEQIREDLQSLARNIKIESNVDSFTVPSATHDYSDLENLIEELGRIEEDLRKGNKLCMVDHQIWMCRHCIHQIRSLMDHLELEAEMEDWGERF